MVRREAGVMTYSALFESTTIPVLEQVANFTQSRHQVLAGNIANWDVPGYRTRDLSPEVFAERLKRAIAARAHEQRYASPLAVRGAGDPLTRVRGDLAGMLRHDDGDVGIEHQVTEIAKNQMQHHLALSVMISQFRLLQTAISERV
jgi:flagellar basal-body rod protein FlgB